MSFQQFPPNQVDSPQTDQNYQQIYSTVAKTEGNFFGSVIAGFFAAIVGAIAWAAVAFFTGYNIGWLAIGVGFIVGYTIRKVGQSSDKKFGVMGALLALFGCIFGNLLTVAAYITIEEGVGFFEVLGILDPIVAVQIMMETFSLFDLLFYGLALYAGYKYSFEPEKPKLKRISAANSADQ